jgi:hypothetical protein
MEVQAVLPLGIEVALHATYLVGSHGSMGLGRSARREVPRCFYVDYVITESEWLASRCCMSGASPSGRPCASARTPRPTA